MQLLQRYVLRELFWPTMTSLFFFTVLMLISRLFRLTDILLQTDIRGGLLLEFIGILTISMITITIPMAILLATLMCFGRLAAENEILAMRAGGLSLWKIFRPVLIASTAVAVLLMYLNAGLIPRMFERAKRFVYDFRFEVLLNLRPRTFFTDFSVSNYDLTLYYDRREEVPESEGHNVLKMHDVALRIYSPQRTETEKEPEFGGNYDTQIFARGGMITGDPLSKSLRIELLDGTILPLNRKNPYENTTLSFQRMTKILPAGTDKRERKREARLMSLREILVGITVPPDTPKYRAKDKLDPLWRDYYSMMNELMMRFSLPLACIAFVMIGMPLAVVVRPGAKSVAFILTFSLMFLYYIILSWGRELGERGNPAGWGLIFLPNFLLAAVGFWLMKRAIRR